MLTEHCTCLRIHVVFTRACVRAGAMARGAECGEWGAATGETRLPAGAYCSFAYSTLACFRIGTSTSASSQRARKFS